MNYKEYFIFTLIVLVSPFGLMAQSSYSLKQSLEIALKNNVSMKNSSLNVNASVEQQKEARTAFFPNVSATGLGIYGFNDLIPASESIPGVDRLFVGSATALQPVYLGGKIANNNKLADMHTGIRKIQLQQTVDQVTLNTEQKYLQIVSLNSKMRTISSSELFISSLVKQMEDNLKAGLIARNDLLKVKVQKSQILLNKTKLRNNRDIALLGFCQYTGIPYDSLLVFSDTSEAIENPLHLYREPEVAIKTRAEYQLLEKSLSIEKLQTRIKRADYLPSVSIGLTAFKSWIGGSSIGTIGSDVTTAGLGVVSIPISGWWGGSHAIKQRKIQEDIAVNNFQDGARQLQIQVLKYWYDLSDAYKQIGLANENMVQASENLKVNMDSYKSGLNNITDLLDAQTIEQQARDQLTDAVINYRIKLTSYKLAAGISD